MMSLARKSAPLYARCGLSEGRRKSAIILSGGGAYGAYEVGVLKALLTGKSPATGYRPLVPDIVSGTSIGAYNSTYMVSRLAAGGAQTAHDLEQLWLERIAGGPDACGNGMFRIRLDPAEYTQTACYIPDPLRPLRTTAQDAVYFAAQLMARTISAMRSRGPLLARAVTEVDLTALFDTEPFYDLIRETIDFDAVYRSPIALSISATVWQTGRPRQFDNVSRTVTARSVQASASMPGVLPPTFIDGEPHVDGGLSRNTPLKPAIAAGAEVVHIVFLDPRVRDIPMRLPLSTMTEMYRMSAILLADETRSQMVEIAQMNRGDSKDHRPAEVYVYRPAPEILEGLGGFLNFERSYVEKLIDAGYQDAVNHSGKPDLDVDAARALFPAGLGGSAMERR